MRSEPEGRFRSVTPADPLADLNPGHVPASDRPRYRLVVRAEPGVDEVRALRALLKNMLRRFGLRCINILPEETPP